MKRRVRLGIALAVLALHVLAPFAAYASTQAVSGFNDLCSVYGKAAPVAGDPAGVPPLRSDGHVPSHCAFCPGGSAAAAILPPTVPSLSVVIAGTQSSPVRLCAAMPAAPTLLPPPRGPPANLPSV